MSRELPQRHPSRTHGASEHLVRLAQRFMREHLGDALSLEEVALAAGCRPRTLIRAFNTIAGEPPIAHFRRLRLEHVRERLQSTSGRRVRITDIATECGFWHLGHLATAYKSHFGETPRQTLINRSHQENHDALHR